MKVTILGGAGTRVPLIVLGLLRFHEELPTEEVALWDVNPEREPVVARICWALTQRYQIPLKILPARSAEEALEGAAFVISSIRVGGAASRIADEAVALAHGTFGQETVGAGGWAMALRTIPPMMDYVRAVQRLAPQAWLLNFTNPVGIVLQALLATGSERVIGVCDTPRELFESLARELKIESGKAFFDYFGLNHLGWVRRVLVEGRDLLAPLFEQPERLAHLYPVPLFEPRFLQQLRLLPTEYLYFYYRAEEAARTIRRQATTRGQMVGEQERWLFAQLGQDTSDPEKILSAYESYLARRTATYLHLETGVPSSEGEIEKARRELYTRAAGYERVAVDIMRAVRSYRATVMPVDVANAGSIDELSAEDAVEVPCLIDSNGARPLAVGSIPGAVRSLLLQVKDYERLTAQAALEGSAARAVQALAANPLIRDRAQAEKLAAEYRRVHRPWLDYLR